MLKKILLCASLLLPFAAPAAHAAPDLKKNNVSGDLNWSVQTTWTLPTKPLDIAQSLDNKKVFVLGTDAKVHIFTPDGKKLGEMPVDPNTSAIDIAARGEMLYLINSKSNSYTAIDISFTQKIDITGAPVQGKIDAPVTLIVFSDFECPWCGKLEPVLKQLLDSNKDKLRIVFKHLPLPMHPNAEPAALAAIAAQKQDKFWQMHDALFQTTNWTPGVIEQTAQKIGLNMEQFKADLSNPETEMQLAKDKTDAQQADVLSTPSLFINGRPVRDRSLLALQTMVNEALTSGGAK
jgi:predicted DsbA family dithiol-disulfide isomerase